MCLIAELLVAAFLLNDASDLLPQCVPLVAAYLATVFILNALVATMLWMQVVTYGRTQLAGVGAAYFFATCMVIPHALAFPGIARPGGLWMDSTPLWLWVMWHVGFPLMIMTSPIAHMLTCHVFKRARPSLVVIAAMAFAAALAGVCSYVVIGIPDALPAVVQGDNYAMLMRSYGPEIIAINVIAVSVTGYVTRGTAHVNRWRLVPIGAACIDVTATLFAGARYTVGWYGGKVVYMCAMTVMVAVLLRALAQESLAATARVAQLEHELARHRPHRAASSEERFFPSSLSPDAVIEYQPIERKAVEPRKFKNSQD